MEQAQQPNRPFDRVDAGIGPAAQQPPLRGGVEGVPGEAFGLSAFDPGGGVDEDKLVAAGEGEERPGGGEPSGGVGGDERRWR